MKCQLTPLKGLKRRISIELPREQVKAAWEAHTKKWQAKTKVAGFRQGKVPLPQVERLHQTEIQRDTLQDLMDTSYLTALKEKNIHPAGPPRLETQNPLKEGEGFHFSVVVEVVPSIPLNPGFKAQLVKPSEEVTDQEMENSLNYLRKMAAAQNATKNKTPAEDPKSPLPEINDDFAKKMGCPSVTVLKEQVKKALKDNKKDQSLEALKGQVMEQMLKAHPVEFLPEDLLHRQSQSLASLHTRYLKSLGKTNQEMEADLKKHKKTFKEQAKKEVHSSYLLAAFADHLKIAISPGEVESFLQKNPPPAKQTPPAAASVRPEDYRRAKNILTCNKVIQHFIDTAEIKSP